MENSIRVLAIVCLSGIFFSGCSSLRIDYEFSSGQNFTDIQGQYSNKDSISYSGYMYYFSAFPVFFSYPWATATLHAPAAINGGNDEQQCYKIEDWLSVHLDFYCGGSATTPTKPPTGTYLVNVEDKSYTFEDVDSRLIDTDLNNVYVVEIKLTMDNSGKISHIDWQWWKKVASNWVQPGNSDLTNQLDNAGFEIGQTNWVGDRVNGDIPLSATGQVVPPTQSFTPGVFRFSFTDKLGYNYGIEWR